jgi:hypothetical protein
MKIKGQELHKCEYKNCENTTTNKKFCSRSCSSKKVAETNKSNGIGFYNSKIQSMLGKRAHKKYPNLASENAKKANITNKINGTGMFYDKKLQSVGGKSAVETNKRNGTGMFHNKEIQSKGGKIGGKRTHELYPNLAIEAGRAAVETNKRNGTSFYDPNIQRKGLLASRTSVIVEGKTFSSRPEAEIGLCIHYQFEELELRKNWEVIVGNKRVDFLIKILKCFVEVHPRYEDGYYEARRKILDDNGYKDYNLVVIK